MLRKSFKEALDCLGTDDLFVGSGEEAVLLVQWGRDTYPFTILSHNGHVLLRLDKGVHFLIQEPVHSILDALSRRIGGEVVRSCIPSCSGKPSKYVKMDNYITPREWIKAVDKILDPGKKTIVEIGFGNGEFLEGITGRDCVTIGIELSSWAVRRALARLEGKEGYYIIKSSGEWALRWLFPESSIDILYILFPFPWPKKPSRRLINPIFVQLLAERLRAGGTVIVATDDDSYSQDIIEVFKASQHFKQEKDHLDVQTKYLRKWMARGRKIHKMVFVKTKHSRVQDGGSPLLQSPLRVGMESPRLVFQRFIPWEYRPDGLHFFRVERCFLSVNGQILLFRTILQDPGQILHRQFLVWGDGALDLLPTWGEIVTPPLVKSMKAMVDEFSHNSVSSTFKHFRRDRP